MNHLNAALALVLLIMLPMVATTGTAEAALSDRDIQQSVDAGSLYFAPRSVSQAMEEVIVRGFVSACANKGGGLCDMEYGWGMVVREIVQSSPSCPMKILDTTWVQIEEPEPTIASDIKVLMWLEVYGYCSAQPENQRWPYLIQLWSPSHYAKAIAAPSSQPCSEGDVKILETCPDGGTWKHRQVCRNSAWVDEYQQCPTPPPVCSEGDVRVLEKCPDGSWSHRRVCRNNAWVDEYQQCPSCPDGQYWDGSQCVCPSGQEWNGEQCVLIVCSEGDVQVLETCPDGSWSHRRVCRNNAWVDERQQCPAQPAGLEIRDAKLVQTVYAVPMIADKPTVVYMKLYSSSKLQTNVKIQFGQTSLTYILDVSAGEKYYWIPGNRRYFVFESPGTYDVVLEILAQDGDKALLARTTIQTEVIHIKGFNLLFIPLELKADQYLPNGSPAPDVTRYCSTSEECFRGVCHVTSPANFIGSQLPVPTQGDDSLILGCSTESMTFDAPHDFIAMTLMAHRVTQEARKRGFDLGIGVVSGGGLIFVYVNGKQEEFTGGGIPTIGAIMQDEGAVWITAAHELGHVLFLLHDQERSEGFEVITGQPTGEVSSLMAPHSGSWITRKDYLQLIDELRLGSFLGGFKLVVLEEKGEKLHLDVYDSQGRHVGFNPSLGAPEVQIPGASYLDIGKAIAITVPLDVSDIRIIVDATQAEEAQESYSLLSVAAVGESSSFATLNETIRSGETKEYSLDMSGTTVNSIRRVPWWDRYQIWILCLTALVIAGAAAATYASTHGKGTLRPSRRKPSSRLASPRVKKIRSNISRPHVKEIQETKRKPRVLKVEEG